MLFRSITPPFAAGTEEWFLAPAFAARHAVTAALLARSGVRGSARVLEGTDGVFSAFAGGVVDVDLTPPVEGRFEIERTRLKAALTCGWNQSMVHQLRELAPPAAEVRSVEVRMSPIAAEYPGVARTSGFGSRSEALLSAPYAAALQLSRGSLDHSGYERLDDPDLLAVASRVTVATDANLEGYATVVDVTLASGEVLRSEDGNDKPRFSLDSSERVIETLGRNYASAGLDPTLVDALVAGVKDVVEGDDPTTLAEALGG